ncbi:MAG: hypothetical protein JXR96_29060 [Deltaproteobacteria bacterium]|nr:hypothetical protein [Deltaproteobacteria bacterium]
MRTTLFFSIWALGLIATPRLADAGQYETLHEVLRHFQVAFVDRANTAALLYGALQGLESAAPDCRIEVLAHPALYRVHAKSGQVEIGSAALGDYKQLEASLNAAADLVLKNGLAKDARTVEHAMIRRLVAGCGDPWSIFLEADLYNRLLDDGSTQVGTAGILVEPHGADLRILDVMPGMQAEKAGIRPGQRVDKVAGRPADHLTELEALALMRGPLGQKVTVVVEGKAHELTFAEEPKRNISVDLIKGGYARIHLHNFRAGTGERLGGVIGKIGKKLKGQLRGLVLDLRGNPGGLVTEGTAVVGLFTSPGLVVSVISKKHMRIEEERSTGSGPYRKLPLVILADHRSASVSEIVIMSLRDKGRAKLVGTKTLGKGTVQVVMELMDGSALKLSTGRYYSPKGTPLYEGIEPDFRVEWDGKGKDVQLERAVRLLRG